MQTNKQTNKKSALRKGWELLLWEFHKCLLPAVPTAHYCDSRNSEPCPSPTRTRSSRQEAVVELQPGGAERGGSPGSNFEGAHACCSPGAALPRPPSWLAGRRPASPRPRALSWSISPPLAPPHCAKCWKRQLQYYCSEAHLLPALDGLALISIAVETGASRVTSLGISYRVGFLYQLRYLLYTL